MSVLFLALACIQGPPASDPTSTSTTGTDTDRPSPIATAYTATTATTPSTISPGGYDCSTPYTYGDGAGQIVLRLYEATEWDDRLEDSMRPDIEFHTIDYEDFTVWEALPVDDPDDRCSWNTWESNPIVHAFEPLDAGEVSVTIGELTSVTRPYGSDHYYSANIIRATELDPLWGGVPVDLSWAGGADVPGMTLPAILAMPPRFDVTGPTVAYAEPDTLTWTWTPGAGIDGRVQALMHPPGDDRLLLCDLEDDGSFKPPPEVYESFRDDWELFSVALRTRRACPQLLPDGRVVNVEILHQGGASVYLFHDLADAPTAP